MDGSEDLPFCATTYDMDADNRWGFCKFQGNVRITIIVRQFLISLFFLLGVCGKCEIRFDFVLMSRSKILLFEKNTVSCSAKCFPLFFGNILQFLVRLCRC